MAPQMLRYNAALFSAAKIRTTSSAYVTFCSPWVVGCDRYSSRTMERSQHKSLRATAVYLCQRRLELCLYLPLPLVQVALGGPVKTDRHPIVRSRRNTLAHHSLSKAATKSTNTATRYLPSLRHHLKNFMNAFEVPAPLLNPYWISASRPLLRYIDMIHWARAFTNTFPMTGKRQIGR